MTKKILISIVFALAFLTAYGQKEDTFEIKGTVAHDYSNYIYLSYGNKVDSVLVQENRFVFTGSVDQQIEARIHTKDGFFTGYFYLENSNMTVNITIQEAITSINSLSGNITAQIMSDLHNYFQEIQSDTEFTLKLYKKLDTIFTENPRNQFCGMTLSEIAMDPILTYEQVLSLYSKLDVNVQNTDDMQSLKASLKKLKNIRIGTKFFNFELPDSNGNLVKTADYKGKILFIEFWASSCKPCRQSNPELVKVYNKYNRSDFEILGVSIDTDKNSWLRAITKDNLNWKNTIAIEGWKNDVVRSLGIQYIPSNYLIDSNGKILAINIIPSDLETKLNEILKQ